MAEGRIIYDSFLLEKDGIVRVNNFLFYFLETKCVIVSENHVKWPMQSLYWLAPDKPFHNSYDIEYSDPKFSLEYLSELCFFLPGSYITVGLIIGSTLPNSN